MYLEINDTRHTCSKRIKTKDTIKYLTVTPAPETIAGTIKMYRDDGFLLCEDNADSYEHIEYTGTLLYVYNGEKPKPPDPTKKPEYRISVLENKARDAAEAESVTLDLLADQEERLCMLELTM